MRHAALIAFLSTMLACNSLDDALRDRVERLQSRAYADAFGSIFGR